MDDMNLYEKLLCLANYVKSGVADAKDQLWQKSKYDLHEVIIWVSQKAEASRQVYTRWNGETFIWTCFTLTGITEETLLLNTSESPKHLPNPLLDHDCSL